MQNVKKRKIQKKIKKKFKKSLKSDKSDQIWPRKAGIPKNPQQINGE